MSVALHYTVDGPEDGPAVLLGPSLGTTVDLWRPQLSTLAKTYRVIRYDHRGHGASPVPAGDYRLEDLAGDVLTLLDGLGYPRVHAAGVSLGGMVAMWLAAHHPERIGKLALVCTSARIEPASIYAERASLVRASGLPSISDLLLARWLPAGAPPEQVDDARAMLADVPDEGYAGCCAAIATMDLTPVLGRISAPTLVVAGGVDQATPVDHAERIVAAIPAARLAVVPGAAHLANLSHATEVTNLLTDFLGSTDGSR